MEKKNIAIVTGASGGLGREFVKILAGKDDISEIWAIARNEDNLNKLRDEHGDIIRIIPMDLTDRANYERISELLRAVGVRIRYLVNCAGFAKFCAYDDIGVDVSLNMIDLNVCACVALGLVCLPYMERGDKIINISSQASFQPLPYQNIYAATKAFMRFYTRALNVELKERGITAITVCPGWLSTGLYDRACIGAQKATNNFVDMHTPDGAAKKAVKDADRGEAMSVYALYTKLTHLASKLVPQSLAMALWLMQQHIK